MTDEALLREHVLYLRRHDAREVTIRHRVATIARMARQLDTPLGEITAEQLAAWQDGLRRRLAVASVRCYTSHTRAFYTWAHHWGGLATNPAAELIPPRVPAGRPRPIGEKDLLTALHLAPEPLRTWLILAGYCGLRAGEIARLSGEGVIHEPGGDFLEVDGKGGRRRTVPCPPEVSALLRGYQRSGLLFRRPDGRPVTPLHVSRTAAGFLAGLGIPATLHQLRHRYGTRMYALTRDLRVVQDLLGHASPATTAGYVAASAVKGQASARRLSRELRSAA